MGISFGRPSSRKRLTWEAKAARKEGFRLYGIPNSFAVRSTMGEIFR
jgi:hypothetical protein